MVEVEVWSREVFVFFVLLEILEWIFVDIKEVVEMDSAIVDDIIMVGEVVGLVGRILFRVIVLGVRVLILLFCKGIDVVRVWIDVRSWEGFMWFICWAEKGWRWDLFEEEFIFFWMECLLIWRRLNLEISVIFMLDLFIDLLFVVIFIFWDNEVIVRDMVLVLGV